MQHRLKTLMANLLLIVTMATPVFAETSEAVVTALDGQQLRGHLVRWQPGELTLERDGQDVSIATDQLLNMRWSDAEANAEQLGSFVELVDGTRLPLGELTVRDRLATLTNSMGSKPVEIATQKIRLVQFSPRSRGADAFWSELDDKPLAGDVLVIQKNATSGLDYLTGVVGDVTSDQVDFRWDGEPISVKRNKIAALAYYHPNMKSAGEVPCWLTTRSGARFPVAESELIFESDMLRLTTVSGLTFEVPIANLHEADFSAGKIVYLSDLQPTLQEWTPRIGLPKSAQLIHKYGLPRQDQSFSGSSLSLQWHATSLATSLEKKNYAKGLALRSRSQLEYRLPAGMKRFITIAGIDPATASQGHVLLEVSADGRMLWQGEIQGSDTPVEISVNVEGARKLRLFVDFAGNLDYGDRLHLVEARVTK